MRALMLTRNFPPLVGGMERLFHHAYEELQRHYDVDLVGPAGCETYVAVSSHARGCRPSPLPWFLMQCDVRSRELARRFPPDLILAGSGLTALSAQRIARSHKVPAIAFVHGLDLVVDNALYQRFFVPALRRCDCVIANSHNTARLAREHGIDANRMRIVHPGVTLPDPDQLPDTVSFRKAHGIDPQDVLLLSVGRFTRRKGLMEFIERALPRIIQSNSRVRLVVVGGNASSAVRGSGDERGRVAAAARRAGVDSHVLLLGVVEDEILDQAYAAARTLVFPVLELAHDVEGFGMVAVEAASRGLPTIAFASGGVPDAVAPGVSGELIAPGDYTAFADAILKNGTPDVPQEVRESCRQFAAQFSWERYGEQLLRICREVTGE